MREENVDGKPAGRLDQRFGKTTWFSIRMRVDQKSKGKKKKKKVVTQKAE